MIKLAKIQFVIYAVFSFFMIGFFTYTNDSINKISAQRIDSNKKVPILVYHNIMDHYDSQQSLVHISPAEFEEHMSAINDAGFKTITFQDYYHYVVNNRQLPEKPIIITFDDGYYSNYEYAYPILKKLDMKATIFVITGRMGMGKTDNVVYPHFGWEEAKEMQNSGIIDIQSHSNMHPVMTELDDEMLQLELRRSRYLIQKELNKPCDVFAYPYGMFNSHTQSMAQRAGYKIQVAVGDDGVNTKGSGLFQLKRLTAKGGTTGHELLEMINLYIEQEDTK